MIKYLSPNEFDYVVRPKLGILDACEIAYERASVYGMDYCSLRDGLPIYTIICGKDDAKFLKKPSGFRVSTIQNPLRFTNNLKPVRWIDKGYKTASLGQAYLLGGNGIIPIVFKRNK